MVRTHSKLWLSCLTPEQHAKTCDYWYTITEGGGPHNAFRRKATLLQWLARVGLSFEGGELPEQGTPDHRRIVGTYRTELHGDTDEFNALRGEEFRTLGNGDYTKGVVTTDPDDIRTVHTLNCNSPGRVVYDYRESSNLVA